MFSFAYTSGEQMPVLQKGLWQSAKKELGLLQSQFWEPHMLHRCDICLQTRGVQRGWGGVNGSGTPTEPDTNTPLKPPSTFTNQSEAEASAAQFSVNSSSEQRVAE